MSRWNDPYGGHAGHGHGQGQQNMDHYYYPNPNYIPKHTQRHNQFAQLLPRQPPNFLTVEEVEARQRLNNNQNRNASQSQGSVHNANVNFHRENIQNQDHGKPIDISHSNLQATAQEFQPMLRYPHQHMAPSSNSSTVAINSDNQHFSNSSVSSEATSASTGAIRRNNYHQQRSTGRNFINRNERFDKFDRFDRRNMPPEQQPVHQQEYQQHKHCDSNLSLSDSNTDTITNTNSNQNGHNRDRRKAGPGPDGTGVGQYKYTLQTQPPNNQQRHDLGSSNNSQRYKNNQRSSNESFGYYGNKDRDRRDWDSWTTRRNHNVKIERGTSNDNWRHRDNSGKKDVTVKKVDKAEEHGKLKVEESKVEIKEATEKVDVIKNKEVKQTTTTTTTKPATKQPNFKKKLDAASQRERLEQMVTHRILECLVCCEKLRHTDKIWSCKQCFHILHLACVQKWAKSSKLETGWRCPACQNVLNEVPSEYRCYCDKFLGPKYEPSLIPHSCGEVCQRKGRNCEHACTLLCHPGPCPDCTVMVQRSCGCGRTMQTVKCNSNLQLTCEGICEKKLNCTLHTCAEKCHGGACNECNESVEQKCYCGKEDRKVPCTKEAVGVDKYACGGCCGKPLSCGNHTCGKTCHDGDCESCPSEPGVVKTCPCGQVGLVQERKSCLDPIPCCDKVCNKELKCGQPGQPHLCQATCHNGTCLPCPLTTMVRCRCGHMDREIACKELTTKADDARCQKKCTKKRLCTKHKCNQYCCIEVEHDCPLPCNHTLSCGLHRCELNCHVGRCPPCWLTSFQELYCECGASVIYPPVPCGTRPPECKKPCSRIRPCGHKPMHNCHSGPCPPCTLFTTKMCHGNHESRQTIPCHQEDFSCGLRCNKVMPCEQHRCIQICHKGACPIPCAQPCTSSRLNCEHSCNQPCHEPPCPSIPCKQTVTVTCECGLRSSTRVCMDLFGDYHKIAMIQLASKIADIQRGQSVDISDIVNKQKRTGTHRTLECNDECRLVDRNRRMAIGLQLRNPDLSAKLTPRYSDYMKQWVKKDARFCQHVHDKLTELVQLAKQSKQKSRSHSFECMNREKRHFVHEYCEHFGCESAAYDKEPNRNIVATAIKDKSWLPSCSIIELLQRESGQRKVPGPTTSRTVPSATQVGEAVSLKVVQQQQPRTSIRPATPPSEFVDYFDNPPFP